MGEECNMHGEIRPAYKIFFGKPKGKRPLGGPKSSWEDNIKTDLQEIMCEIVN
jgi:hypothetical protein